MRNETANVLNEVTPDLQHSDQLWWLFALFIIIFFIILMCYMLRKRIFRCFSKAEPLCNDSENRNPESGVPVKVRSDSPDSLSA
ncbi:hypothetical protein Q8A67_006071 [Cirrhinus molitorella]|uniref:Uncharacterized protein n=1 Tax=Cirrhinus molitorella TaxID=172907 RepID=A0AA88Q1H2_9TELE|nr:hypothetical protein Q8A67_006071 [Cirrhinus molitorella]